VSPFETALGRLSIGKRVDTERARSRSVAQRFTVALYRFLFAPVLLAVAVLTTSPRRVAPQPAPPAAAAPRLTLVPTSHAPGRAPRALSSHPATAR
jgi:hypothetical protein